MYEAFYGLREHPFDLTPNPRFLYLSPQHREALSTVKHAIRGRKGITLFIGEAGTGKTTILRTALAAFGDRAQLCVYLNNPALTRSEFYEFLAAGFRLSTPAATSKAKFLIELERLARDRASDDRRLALIIDEGQSLPRDLLEEVRLLANIESATEKLLPVVLAGQPELAATLERPEFRQLKQRVGMRCDLGPLDVSGTAAYISGRIRIAGGDIAQILTRDAVLSVYERSGGIPRTISVICENAMIAGFALDTKPIGRDIVLEVCRDFRLDRIAAAGPPHLGAAAADMLSDDAQVQAGDGHGNGNGNGNGTGEGAAPPAEPPVRNQIEGELPARMLFARYNDRKRHFLFF